VEPIAGSGRNGADIPSCIAVIGVGRSGTSATTGLLVKLGLAPPQPGDLIPATSSNEQGHWESRRLVRFNSLLLRGIGCSPYAPPEPVASWRELPGYEAVKAKANTWIPSTFAGGTVALKDPRMCLTLGFWREVLPPPMAALLVVRNPIRNARSRVARDGVAMTLGLAIWDRYQRSCALGLEGLPTLVVEYDSMLANPRETNAEIVQFLRHLRIEVTPEAEASASDWLDSSLRHQTDGVDEYDQLATVQREMYDQLCALKGFHESWQPPTTFPPPPVWVDDILGVQRSYDGMLQAQRNARSTRLYRLGSGVRKAARRLPGRSADPSAGS
jgi:hypothetical protein